MVHVYWKITHHLSARLPLLPDSVRAFTYHSGRTCNPMPRALAEEWVKEMNHKYGAGSHWMKEVKRA